MKRFETFWSVESGPDTRHLNRIRLFPTLRDAKAHCTKCSKAYKLTRHTHTNAFPDGLDTLIDMCIT